MDGWRVCFSMAEDENQVWITHCHKREKFIEPAFLPRKTECVTTFFKTDSDGNLPVVWKCIAAFVLVHFFFPGRLKSWLFSNFSTVSFIFNIAVPRIKLVSNVYLFFSIQRTMWFRRKSKDLHFFSLCCLQVLPLCVGLCRNVLPS